MPKTFIAEANDEITPCPKCGNNTEFIAHSTQVAVDSCEVWVVCKCGYDPTEFNGLYQYEDVGGGTDDGNCRVALDCWNDAIAAKE